MVKSFMNTILEIPGNKRNFGKCVKSNEFRATFLEGIGERPPEDVGGEGGYEEYLRITADVNHPAYVDMNTWADNHKEKNISQEKINYRLKQVIKGYHYSYLV
jgi:hypothetical protein